MNVMIEVWTTYVDYFFFFFMIVNSSCSLSLTSSIQSFSLNLSLFFSFTYFERTCTTKHQYLVACLNGKFTDRQIWTVWMKRNETKRCCCCWWWCSWWWWHEQDQAPQPVLDDKVGEGRKEAHSNIHTTLLLALCLVGLQLDDYINWRHSPFCVYLTNLTEKTNLHQVFFFSVFFLGAFFFTLWLSFIYRLNLVW